MFFAWLLCAVAAIVVGIHGYNVNPLTKSSSNRCHQDQPQAVSRQNFLSIVAGGLTATAIGTKVDGNGTERGNSMTLMSSAWAKDAAITKGTKEDPAFQACLSQCMYDCTKPKGVEQKTRSECLPECKQQCATTKSQLLRGEPIKRSE